MDNILFYQASLQQVFQLSQFSFFLLKRLNHFEDHVTFQDSEHQHQENYGNFFRWTIFWIICAKCSTSILWQGSLTLQCFLSLACLFSNLSLQIWQIFAFLWFPAFCLLITFLFKINYLHSILSQGFAKLLRPIFTSLYIMLIFYVFKWQYCRYS